MKQSEALDMITKIQLAHQAMESACKRIDELKEENKNLKEALAKQEQRNVSEQLGEPVSWEKILGAVSRGWCHEENANKTMDIELAMAIVKEVKALYTTPPQRTWVGLTDEEIWQIATDCTIGGDLHADKFAKAIEAKVKENA
jgi:hypothetical protein